MKKILSCLHNGEVMLLHPTSKTNAEIMKELITELKNRGFSFGTLDELTA
jgi:peptidoglycan-N-acetylmuramic acid deacetylase